MDEEKIIARFNKDLLCADDYIKFITNVVISQSLKKSAVKVTYNDDYLSVFREERWFGDKLLE